MTDFNIARWPVELQRKTFGYFEASIRVVRAAAENRESLRRFSAEISAESHDED
ncbi:MAG TPA: hypothetical protein VNM92_02350 [Thermoanaerobaculia bacterium]|nr:hypothetical protein [Thermoanaerobaculia bacterium]